MPATSIDSLLESLMSNRPAVDPAYAAKQLHQIPTLPVVDRHAFVLEQCTGKAVLEYGASGALHDAIVGVAAAVVGVDREAGPGVVAFDLDDVTEATLPAFAADVIVCGEVLEHLSNPGWFLARLHRQWPSVPVVVTVPNAFSSIAQKWLAKGIENVNRDHVAWYSYKTLCVLLARSGYVVKSAAWYNGSPRVAEGLVVVTE